MMVHFGLTGFPLTYSLSPQIHAAALKACGLPGEYCLFPVAPQDGDGLRALLERVRRGDLHGLNVTIPHKQTVLPLLDTLTLAARTIGAVNTIFIQNGRLTGENTDAPGFLADLQNLLGAGMGRRKGGESALVFGAGGSARAVVYALLQDGWKVTLAARRPQQAQRLARHYGDRNLPYEARIAIAEHQAASLAPLLPVLDLVVNATPLGMSPYADGSPWPAGLPFPPRAAVYDLVYHPCETRLVREARAAGLLAASGLGMLVEQAALAFEAWTGQSPPRAALLDAL